MAGAQGGFLCVYAALLAVVAQRLIWDFEIQ